MSGGDAGNGSIGVWYFLFPVLKGKCLMVNPEIHV